MNDCQCGHPLDDHNNADSCSKYLECGCRKYWELGEEG